MVDDKPRSTGLQNLFAIPESVIKGVIPADGTVHHIAAAIGLLTLASIMLWNWFRPKSLKVIPGTLVGVVLATAVTAVFQLPVKHVDIPGNIWSTFTLPNAHTFARLIEPNVLLSAFAIAMVASAETLLSAAAVDRMHTGPRANYDKELSAQGVGNFLCGVIGVPPMTGVIVRSSANVQAGAKSRLSTILHGVWILAFVLLFPQVLRMIPTASLAGILVFTGIKLIEVQHVRRLAEYGRMPVVIYVATVIGIVSVDLLTGVLIGIGFTIASLLWKTTRLEISHTIDDARRRCDVHLRGMGTFLRLPQLLRVLDQVPPDHAVHLHIHHLYLIDHTTLDLLKSMAKMYHLIRWAA